MYKLVYIFLIAFSGCFAGTQTVAETSSNKGPLTPIQENPTLSSVITLGIEQVTNYQNLELRLVDIEDSRCATGVTCIWAGQLIVTLEVSNEVGEKTAVKELKGLRRQNNKPLYCHFVLSNRSICLLLTNNLIFKVAL